MPEADVDIDMHTVPTVDAVTRVKKKGKGLMPDGHHDRVIPDFIQPVAEADEVGSTQESTAAKATPFPQVRILFSSYLCLDDHSDASGSSDSSGSEWLESLGGESSDDEGDVDNSWVDDLEANQHRYVRAERQNQSFEDWFANPQSYRSIPLNESQFHAFYNELNWTSDHVTLLGSRDTFTGPRPGATAYVTSRLPTPGNLFDLFWPDIVVDRIVRETNRYATIVLPPKKPCGAVWTKGCPSWEPLTPDAFQAWMGILVYMGVVDLPNRRLYWSQKHDVLQCKYIPRIMSCKRWEAITRCLHLVDNLTLERVLQVPIRRRGAGGCVVPAEANNTPLASATVASERAVPESVTETEPTIVVAGSEFERRDSDNGSGDEGSSGSQ